VLQVLSATGTKAEAKVRVVDQR